MGKTETYVELIKKSTLPLNADIINEASRNNISIFYFDGSSIGSKKDFFNTAKKVMNLPDYSGNNWDAFEECINDLSWISAEGYIFVFDNTSAFFSKHPDDAETLLTILNDARIMWLLENVPFEYLLASDKAIFKK